MKTRKIHPIPLIIALLWLTALGFATFYDLELSLAIADETSVYGRVLEVAGEPPAILFASFNFALMAAHFLKKPKRSALDLTLAALTFIVAVGTVIFTVSETADYLVEYGLLTPSTPLTLSVYALSALIAAAFMLAVMLMKRETVERCFGTACRCAAAAAATLVIIWAFKLVWGRVRFRQLDNDLARFTPWYLPQGFTTEYFSFPSGHTANAAVIFTVTYYLRCLPERFGRYKPLIYTLLGVWIALVAFSRVRVGAHYLSDVLLGMAITFAIVYFARPRKQTDPNSPG